MSIITRNTLAALEALILTIDRDTFALLWRLARTCTRLSVAVRYNIDAILSRVVVSLPYCNMYLDHLGCLIQRNVIVARIPNGSRHGIQIVRLSKSFGEDRMELTMSMTSIYRYGRCIERDVYDRNKQLKK